MQNKGVMEKKKYPRRWSFIYIFWSLYV